MGKSTISVEDIVKLIPFGRESAIHMNVLASMLHISEGKVKKLVKDARKQGANILSSSNGYWQSDDNEEIRCFFNTMCRRAISHFTCIKGMQMYENERNGQMRLTDAYKEALGHEQERNRKNACNSR